MFAGLFQCCASCDLEAGMLAYRYFPFSFLFVYCFNLEVAIARAEEARQLALLSDSSGDSRMGRYSWDMDSVRRWKRKLDIQHREYKAVCCCLLLL